MYSNHERLEAFSSCVGSWRKDKGGPRKGGFLNNRLSSYADLYFRNEINGMCIFILENNLLFRKPPLLGPLPEVAWAQLVG